MRRTFEAIGSGALLGLLAVVLVATGCSASDISNVPKVTELSQQEFLTRPPEGALILDVRTEAEFRSGHVPGAMNISHDQLSSRLSELDSKKDRPVIVYCQSGVRAGLSGRVLVESGYTNVFHLEGDMQAWLANELPTE